MVSGHFRPSGTEGHVGQRDRRTGHCPGWFKIVFEIFEMIFRKEWHCVIDTILFGTLTCPLCPETNHLSFGKFKMNQRTSPL